MPISPRTTDAYINGSNLVDVIVTRMDNILSSSDEKFYRHGTDDDYFYTFAFAVGHLTPEDIAILRQSYVNAGWGNVQARNFEGPGDAEAVWVRIFRNENSHFSRWD